MKNWMALLLACLLCLCAAGATAEEPVTLNIYGEICYDIYPNGYISSENADLLHQHTGSYIITGYPVGEADTPIEFHANAYGEKPGDNRNVSYDVTLENLYIVVGTDSTAICFFAGDVDNNAKNCKITINLSSIDDGVGEVNYVRAIGYPVFNNNQPENNNAVEILVHNVSGTLNFSRHGSHNENIVSRGVTLTYDNEAGEKVTIDGNVENDPNNDKDLWIEKSSCPYHLTYQPTTATCTAAGKQGYYTCTICKRIYLNENATGETTLADLPEAGPLGHELTHVDGKPATCTEDGNIEHYRCTREDCGRLFSDANGTKELTDNDVNLPAQHHLEKVPGKDPTYEQDGNIEYYHCTRCDRLFTDVNGTKELSSDEVILPMLARTDDLPQTGDSSHLLGWAALLGACCAGLWRLRRRG